MKHPTIHTTQGNTSAWTHPLSSGINGLVAVGSIGLLVVMVQGAAIAAPQDGQVAAGQAAISQSGALTTIDQSSSRAVINWGSFNVGADETVRFNQPSANSATLNRVMGNDASSILGRISANGQVFLVNPNGILFGRSAQVDVGSLVASTANITDSDFMAGRLRFTEPGNPGATVENQGSITIADGGFAALVGPGVRNSGFINARLGRVTLAGGEAFILDLNGDQLINLVVNDSIMDAFTDANGVSLSSFVDHSGTINAEGGVVTLTVNTVKRLLDNVVNVSGVIRATGFESRAGVISLLGGADTKVVVSGLLDASGVQAGEVNVTGKEVTLTSTAMLDAGSDSGDGGSIFVGGNWQGQGPLANATTANVERGATLNASGGESGSGGTVVVWSDDSTTFAGNIISTSGVQGGQVEVSGKQQLAFDGDVRAASLLLDPADLTFGTSGDETLPGDAATGNFTVKVDAVNRQLVAGTSVNVTATNNITVNDGAVLGAASNTTPGGNLTLAAGNNIALNGSVVLNNGNFTAIATNGTFTQGTASVIATGAGAIDITANGLIRATNLITNGAVKLTSTAGAVEVANAISGSGTGARVASLDVVGRNGVTLSAGALVQGVTTLSSAAGAVTTTGTTLDSKGNIEITGNNGIVTSGIVTEGAVTLTSANGGVTVGGAVAGVATPTVNAATANAQALTIHSNGAVTLNGAALGAGGLIINGGVVPGQRASAATFATASVFSTGAVDVQTTGNIDLAGAAGLSAGGVTFNSSAGSVSTGASAPITSSGAVSLTGNSIQIRGTSGTTLGGIEITSPSNMTLIATAGDIVATGKLRTAGAKIQATSNGSVTLNEVATWASGATNSGWLDVNAGLDVVLSKALGGDNTGYKLSADKYDILNRPEVGRVTISSGRDVELNGLNLDGNTAATDITDGLSIIAANRLVSNNLIAVNKGNIVLRTTSAGTTNGVMNTNGIYLGNSVYSRGYDTLAGKTGYNITVGGTGALGTRGNIFLFDNTNDFAVVADSTAPLDSGGQEHRIAKIVIANNVANYKTSSDADDPLLVAAGNFPTVTVGADNLVQTQVKPIEVNATDTNQPLTLANMPVAVPANGAAIGLKVQVFNSSLDRTTEISEVLGDDVYEDDGNGNLTTTCSITPCSYAGIGVDNVTGFTLDIDFSQDPNVITSVPVTMTTQPAVSSGGANAVVAFVMNHASTNSTGHAEGFVDLVSPSIASIAGQSVTTTVSEGSNQSGHVGYELRGRVVQVEASTSAVTRELIYSGVIQTESVTASFDNVGNLNSTGSSTGQLAVMGTGANSNPGFSSIGGFGTQTGSTLTGALNNTTGLPPVSTPTPTPAPITPTTSAPESYPPSTDLLDLDRQGTVPGANDSVELALGQRPGADADLGRGSAYGGSPANVFRKRYLIAQSSDTSVCAPNDVQAVGSEGQSGNAQGGGCVRQ